MVLSIFPKSCRHLHPHPLRSLAYTGDLPSIVRLVFVVPRNHLSKLNETFEALPLAPGPSLIVDIQGYGYPASVFSSLDVVFGRVVSSPGPDGEGEIVTEEDSNGIGGNAPLVLSFWIPSFLVFGPKKMTSTKFSLSLQPTPSVFGLFFTLLGVELRLFSAILSNKDHLFFCRETLRHLKLKDPNTGSSSPPKPDKANGQPVNRLTLTQNPIKIATFSMHIDIVDSDQKNPLLNGAVVTFEQASPCTAVVRFSKHHLNYVFPCPIDGQVIKLRIARKQSFIEVITPVWTPMTVAWKTIMNRSSISHVHNHVLTSRNIHHVVLDSLPDLDIRSPELIQQAAWYETHSQLAMSDREYAKGGHEVPVDEIDALVSIKFDIHKLFMSLIGLDNNKPIALTISEQSPDGGKDLISIIITNLRLDSASYTLMLDGFMFPAKTPVFGESASADDDTSTAAEDYEFTKQNDIQQILLATKGNQMRAWKQLLPAFVERCRQWSHKVLCEYIAAGQAPISYDIGRHIICSCGRGQDVNEFSKLGRWTRPFASHVTRIAISPIFGVSYLESLMGEDRSPQRKNELGTRIHMCWNGLDHALTAPIADTSSSLTSTQALCAKCHSPGHPRLLTCSKCSKIKYCSAACQKQDWNAHKLVCTHAWWPETLSFYFPILPFATN